MDLLVEQGYSHLSCTLGPKITIPFVKNVSPTVFRYRSYRFFFFSREERRRHIHVRSPDGEAKFWIEPEIELVVSRGLSSKELKELENIIRENENEIRKHWNRHFAI